MNEDRMNETLNQHLFEARNLSRYFRSGGFLLKAVDGVSFSLDAGETLGIVGESGCGKTTLGRLAMRLIEPSAGDIFFEGKDIGKIRGGALKSVRRRMQMVFQDPFASLNPRMTVGRNIEEPLIIHRLGDRRERRRAVLAAMEAVNLPAGFYDRYPHAFSGGQRQRVVIARALVLKPGLIVCDEPVSALDVSVQAQILNLLCEQKEMGGLSYIFIAHGLNVVRHISDKVAVMYMGKIVETAEAEELFSSPRHPYTEALLSSIPDRGGGSAGGEGRVMLKGDVPSLIDPPTGCHFHTRCLYAGELCRNEAPALRGETRQVACHFPLGDVGEYAPR